VATVRSLHKARFPDESDEYRRARNRLLRSEVELRRQIEAVAAQRRKLPLGGRVSTDYVFDASKPDYSGSDTVRLSELFSARKNTLFLYNFMFPEAVGSVTPCPSCTSIIDAIDGAAPHVAQRVNFAVIAKAPIAKFRQHALKRGWQHVTLLSSANNTFNVDYHAQAPNGQQFPLAHVFTRRGKKIRHFWSSELWFVRPNRGQDMRHVDFMWPMWSMFDRTPEGRGATWGPSLSYP
jgi:predicted dithiol-disulfide oxidoreductase (DUF899 family)